MVVPELTKVPAEVFRAYDVRGIVEQQLTPDLVYHIARALGSEIIASGSNNIVIGCDGRISSPGLKTSACKGLLDSGVNVVDIGICTSPMLYFACFNLAPNSGLMITGSHNPPEYNGMKMLIEKMNLTSDGIQKLYQRIKANDYSAGKGKYSQEVIEESYVDAVVGHIKLAKPVKIAVDCGHGVGALIAEKLFKSLGCEVVPLHCTVDGTFPCHHPDPSISENMQDLVRAVVDNNCDLGLAFDGDADRLGVVASDGKIIWPDRQMMVFAEYFLAKQPNDYVVFDVKCSKNLANFIKKIGGKPVMWKTGHSLIKAKMHALGAKFSGEMSGHLFFGEPWFGFDDGIYAGALLCQLFASQQLKSENWFARLPESFSTEEIKLPILEQEKFAFIENLSALGTFAGASINKIDGLRIEYDYGWGLVRASNTTPCLTLRFEADCQQDIQKIKQIFAREMKKIKPDANWCF